jgi:hypothetical protein
MNNSLPCSLTVVVIWALDLAARESQQATAKTATAGLALVMVVSACLNGQAHFTPVGEGKVCSLKAPSTLEICYACGHKSSGRNSLAQRGL